MVSIIERISKVLCIADQDVHIYMCGGRRLRHPLRSLARHLLMTPGVAKISIYRVARSFEEWEEKSEPTLFAKPKKKQGVPLCPSRTALSVVGMAK